jgi:hypothetical protein
METRRWQLENNESYQPALDSDDLGCFSSQIQTVLSVMLCERNYSGLLSFAPR